MDELLMKFYANFLFRSTKRNFETTFRQS